MMRIASHKIRIMENTSDTTRNGPQGWQGPRKEDEQGRSEGVGTKGSYGEVVEGGDNPNWPPNLFELAFVPLSQGKFALIDICDLKTVGCKKWFIMSAGYAGTDGGATLMHRRILCAVKGIDVDHINRYELDNRRSNLRCVPRWINNLNSASRRGVSWQKSKCRWRARISCDGREYFIGRFKSYDDARARYESAKAEVIRTFCEGGCREIDWLEVLKPFLYRIRVRLAVARHATPEYPMG